MAEVAQLEHYLTPKFFDAAQAAGAVGISHDVELIHEVEAFVRAETGRGLPAPVGQVDFAYFLAEGGRGPRSWDTHYFQAGPDFAYLPSDQLAVPSPADRLTVPKATIAATGRTVLEVQARDLATRPLTGALVRAMTTPTPEDARLTAGPGAWIDTVKGAFTGRGRREAFSPTTRGSGRPDLEDEAIRRFPGALLLDRPHA